MFPLIFSRKSPPFYKLVLLISSYSYFQENQHLVDIILNLVIYLNIWTCPLICSCWYFCLERAINVLDIFGNLFLFILSFTSCRSFLIGTRSTKHQKGFPGDWLASGVVFNQEIGILKNCHSNSHLEVEKILYKIWSKHYFDEEKNKCLWDGSLATGEFCPKSRGINPPLPFIPLSPLTAAGAASTQHFISFYFHPPQTFPPSSS